MINKTPAILIIDDQTSSGELLRKVLTGQNYTCDAVYSARAAVDILNRQVFDLVLINIHLLNSEGLELLKKMHELFPSIPAVFIAVTGDMTSMVETRKTGSQDNFIKPFDQEGLFEALQNALNIKSLLMVPDITNPNLSDIDAIALGVETRQDMLDIHSEKVVRQTIAIARQMGLNQDTINQWIDIKKEEKSRKFNKFTNSFIKPG